MRYFVAVVLSLPAIAGVALLAGVCASIVLNHCGVSAGANDALSWMVVGSATTIGVQMVADLVCGKI